jgi:hypothetical protein
MARPFEFERYQISPDYQHASWCPACQDYPDAEGVIPRAEFDGAWVKAEDAIAREKANAAEIARLTALVAQLTPAA